MLSTDERKVLEIKVLGALPGVAGYTAVAAFLGPDLARQMPTYLYPLQLAQWMVEQALLQPSPSIFVKMVRAVDDLDAGAASISTLANRLDADPSGWVPLSDATNPDWRLEADPLEVDELGSPFLDREGFRRRLPRLGAEQGPGCLLVQGDKGAGKTYLSRFCRRLSAQRPGLRVGFAEIGGAGTGLPPQEPALRLGLELGTDMARRPRSHASPDSYARYLASWIAAWTSTPSALPALAILDQEHETTVSDAVHTFVQELVRQIQTDPATHARLRVILLGYDHELLRQAGLEFDAYTLEYIEAHHIRQWLARRFPEKPEYMYEDAVDMIIAESASMGVDRLRGLALCTRMATTAFLD
ncbi:hypothetical protein [Thiocapsa bogorovii]|uniref:hypothetical protein n=1 Tax=Thiocapsa bogorovii TaxID=521689 RepID=UPI001E2C3458|nr:hypothetical protein [Thiocapsa bogorovii]UHD16370.1 hypothetical protein LT988_24535 [Thiocapsa bogorovii]